VIAGLDNIELEREPGLGGKGDQCISVKFRDPTAH